MTSDALSIEVKELRKRFGAFKAVENVSFDVRKGEIYGFLGANGAGKSTTIRMLCGLLEPSSGYAHVAGHDVCKHPDRVKQSIGYMCQKFTLYGDLTVRENIRIFGGLYKLSRARIKQRTDEVLQLLRLTEKADSLAGPLPRGFQQRLAFACAILHEPQVIFLDEPTGGVDPLQRRVFWDQIYDFSSRGITVFVTTHFLDEAEFCNRITLIHAGRIVATDTPTGLKSMLHDLDIFEVVCDPAVKAMEVMQGMDWVKGVSIFGSTVHVSARCSANAGTEIGNVLRKHGVTVDRVDKIVPSLEDVFLHLVEDSYDAA